MTAQNFMKVVWFKLKSGCVDKYFEVIAKTSFSGDYSKQLFVEKKLNDYEYNLTSKIVFTHKREHSMHWKGKIY